MLYVHPRGRGDALFWVGLALWALGWYINLHSDNVLRSLRAPGETGDGLPFRRLDGLHSLRASDVGTPGWRIGEGPVSDDA